MKNESLRKISEKLEGKLGTTAEVLLGAIPYAGGTLAALLGNHLADKKLEKIINTLDSLVKKVEVTDAVIDKLLTESQVCELLEKHITEIVITSDDEKIEFLKNSLNNSFTCDNLDFQEKELFLNTLKNLTTAEILIFKKIYLKNDPFVDTIYPTLLKNNASKIATNNINIEINSVLITPSYIIESTIYEEGNQSLENYFESIFDTKWPLLKGGCLQLDSKGLTNIQHNFNITTRKKVKMNFPLGNNGAFTHEVFSNTQNGLSTRGFQSINGKTAYESCKTDFGIAFMKYITN